MAGIQNYWEFCDDFFGGGTLTTAGQGDPWVVTTTGSSTAAYVDGSSTGEVTIDNDATAEVQNLCLSFGDKLSMGIGNIQGVEWRVKMNQAALDATTSLAFGLAGDRNAAIDSIAQALLFRVIGGDSTTAVVVESDDGTNDNNDVATGQTLINAYKTFKIDFSQGTSDVRFYMTGDNNSVLKRVATTTTFDMSNYTGSLQPFIQFQKTSDTNTDGVTFDYFKAWGTR